MSSKPNYGDNLKNPLWQRKRLFILQRDNFTCVLCGDNRTTLAIHHLSYSGNPWEVDNSQLRTVCLHCHDIIHHFEPVEIIGVHKQISLNKNCWEIVAYSVSDIVFCYLFFEKEMYTDKPEIITVYSTLKTAA